MFALHFFVRMHCGSPTFTEAAFTHNISKYLVHIKEEAPVETFKANEFDTPILENPQKLPVRAIIEILKGYKHKSEPLYLLD